MIKDLRVARDFYLGFANNPQVNTKRCSARFKLIFYSKAFITDWIASQCKDLKGMQDMSGNPDVERRADTFKEEWVNEAVMRYFHNKLQQRRAELEQAINQKA